MPQAPRDVPEVDPDTRGQENPISTSTDESIGNILLYRLFHKLSLDYLGRQNLSAVRALEGAEESATVAALLFHFFPFFAFGDLFLNVLLLLLADIVETLGVVLGFHSLDDLHSHSPLPSRRGLCPAGRTETRERSSTILG